MIKKIGLICLISLIGLIYFLTLPKSIGFGDSGTMAAAAVSLGIPHPPGFPSYILLGYLFSLLPFGSMLWRLQLLSVLPAMGIVLLIFFYVLKPSKFWPALLTALLTAFFYGFWSQAGNVESYLLTNFFIFGIIFLGLAKTPAWLIGLLLGLGAGLNPIGIVVIPALLYLYITNKSPKKILIMFLVAVPIAILIYSYLPLRASTHPFLNWGDPQGFLSFIKYITGSGLNINSDSFVNGFTGSIPWFIDAWVRFGYLAIVELSPLVLVLSLWGAWNLWQKERNKFWLWMITLLTNISLAGIYVSGNRDIWLMTSLIVLIILAGEGLVRLGKKGLVVGIIMLVIVVFISAPKILSRVKTDISGQYLTDLYQNLPQNSLLIGGGETFNALTLYGYEVAKIRPDVTPVDFTIFYGQQWYRNTIALSFPRKRESREKNTGSRVKPGMTDTVAMPAFSDELEFSRILEDFAQKNSDRPVFITGYLLTQPVYANSSLPAYVPQIYQLEQHGLVYQLIKSEAPSPKHEINSNDQNVSDFENSWFLESNYQKALDVISMEYAFSFEKTGDYFLDKGEEKTAFSWYDKAHQASPLYFDQNRLSEKAAQAAKVKQNK